MVKKILMEPIVHFLILGGILYLYYDVTHKVTPRKTVISISQFDIQKMKQSYKKEFHKAISKEYLDALIAQKYYEKILLNQAQTLKIVQDDAQITAMIIKKMGFILSNTTKVKEPSEDELYQYYKKNITDYSKVDSLSFYQIYFSQQNEHSAKELLKLLSVVDINATTVATFGEKSQFPNSVKNSTYGAVEKEFGKYFTRKLFRLKSKKWHKGIHLQEGVSLVYITQKRVGEALPFDEVQDRVYSDYMSEKREQVKKDAYKKLSIQYEMKSSL